MADYVAPISELTGKMPQFAGGGRGQRAFVVLDDGTKIEGRGVTKDSALLALLAAAQRAFPPKVGEDAAMADIKRRRIHAEYIGARAVGAAGPSLLSNGHQEGAHEGVAVPGCPDCIEAAPKAKGKAPKGTGRPRACDSSCLFAHTERDKCVCQCAGANHQTGWVLFSAEKIGRRKVASVAEALDGPARKKGGRECACGCGESTSGGLFRQGHDRRLHVALGRVAEGSPFFKEEDGVGLVLTPLGRKALREASNG